MRYYLHKKYYFGARCAGPNELHDAIKKLPGCVPIKPQQFEEITEDQYENAVLDLRYEDGEWQQ